MAESIKIEGMEAFKRAMKELPQEVSTRVLRRAVAAGTAIVRDEAQRTNAFKDRSGTLRANIKMFYKKDESSPTRATYYVFVPSKGGAKESSQHFDPTSGKISRGRLRFAGKPYYWRFLEFGTSKLTARPFLRPAFKAKWQEAARVIAEAFRHGVDRAARRLAAK